MTGNLQFLKNDELISQTKNLVTEERRIQVALLLNLKEIERRKLFLELGYSSLFDFVTKELKYSESAGYRRIQAMRLLKSAPEVEHKISEGTLSLTAAAQLQTFIKSEEKQSGPILKETTQKLVAELENKSSREVEKHLLSLKTSENVEGFLLKSEKVRQVTDVHTEIKFVVTEEMKQAFDELRLRLAHVNPEMSYQDLFSYLAKKALKQLSPKLKSESETKLNENGNTDVKSNEKSLPASEVKIVRHSNYMNLKKPTRFISKKIKDEVWLRDKGCCTFISSQTKRKCESKFQLQIDHVYPFALGGSKEVSNLRLLCGQHNRWQANKVFQRSLN